MAKRSSIMSVIDTLLGTTNREAKKAKETTQRELNSALAEVRAAIDAKIAREEAQKRNAAAAAKE